MLGVKSFIDAMDKVAYEAYRVLKKRKDVCCYDW